jgi:beta-lactam-binding protein with PASTA domain
MAETERQRHRRVVLAVTAASLAALAAGCSSREEPQVVMPNVIGMNPEAALTAVCDARLSLGQIRVVEQLRATTGPRAALQDFKVRSSEPSAGMRVPRGTAVTLRIAAPRNASISVQAECPGSGVQP